MSLDHPSFPVFILEDEIRNEIRKLFLEKNWQDSDLTFEKARLAFTPFYHFKYLVHIEKEKNGQKELEEMSGINVFDPFTLDFLNFIAEFVKVKRPKKLSDIKVSDYKVFEPELTLEETKAWVILKLSKDLNVSKEEIVLSALTLFYYPIWRVKVKLHEEDFEFKIDGFKKEGKKLRFLRKDSVPLREKPLQEILDETIQDLKTPKRWFDYFISTIKSFFSVLKNPRYRIIIILIIVFIIAYFIFK